ncbi:haloacid dehalogenase-like hydrolase [Blastopirellula sp. JC732]|uniref:Haloacid dehalogenase-like hydrolase n=1 Tax=Blastopirellula sediminis TaxID=2894196 RepID=A0A9X1MLC2_9BACT|nr:HAD family hydrolase [Blastopirellula sediminis]MCC9608459.1 haloacid dehalogenase-like hydrolase [Blastopirellula sediminis]MCC9628764.1 haloacid dehalogenase-like hydrolase [Blastopirellula sediminis]
MINRTNGRWAVSALATLLLLPALLVAQDVLPSWNNTAAKKAIVDFVAKVTDENSPDFVPVADRIATFDNDGTLWTEHPMYTQMAFAIDRVKALAPTHPEWKDQQPFKAVLDNDLQALSFTGQKGLVDLVLASHTDITTTDFEAVVKEWFATHRHPRFQQPYTQCTFKPMVELLEYLRANGFKTFIVSGGGIEFMRPITLGCYGIPSDQVVGSTTKTKFEMKEGGPVLMRLPEIDFIDDHDGKPVGINRFIGKRPIASFGNSGGDREMLEWTSAGEGLSLKMLVFHDDAKREYAYGPANGMPDTKFGNFPQDLMEEAEKKGWVVISMKDDWKQIFTFEK